MNALETRILELIIPALQGMGVEIVQVKLVQGTKRKTLQVLAENPSTGRITLDEITKASRTISAILDVEDAISGAFNLEVSSPGIDRPLIKLQDFQTYIGFEAKIETALMVEGRRKFRGKLMGVEGELVAIEVDTVRHELAHSNITQAKLVLSDALIKAHQNGAFTKQANAV